MIGKYIHAKEANRMAKVTAKEFSRVMMEIERIAIQGIFSATFKNLSEGTRTKLKELGYFVVEQRPTPYVDTEDTVKHSVEWDLK